MTRTTRPYVGGILRIRLMRSIVDAGSSTPSRAASTVRCSSSTCARSRRPSPLVTAPVRCSPTCSPSPRAETSSAVGKTTTWLAGRWLTRAMSSRALRTVMTE